MADKRYQANGNLIQIEIDIAKQMFTVESKILDAVLALKAGVDRLGRGGSGGDGGFGGAVVGGLIGGGLGGGGGGASAAPDDGGGSGGPVGRYVARQRQAAVAVASKAGAITRGAQAAHALQGPHRSHASVGGGVATVAELMEGAKPVTLYPVEGNPPPAKERKKAVDRDGYWRQQYEKWNSQKGGKGGSPNIPTIQMSGGDNDKPDERKGGFKKDGGFNKGLMLMLGRFATVYAAGKFAAGSIIGDSKYGDNLSVYNASQQEALGRSGTIQGGAEILYHQGIYRMTGSKPYGFGDAVETVHQWVNGVRKGVS